MLTAVVLLLAATSLAQKIPPKIAFVEYQMPAFRILSSGQLALGVSYDQWRRPAAVSITDVGNIRLKVSLTDLPQIGIGEQVENQIELANLWSRYDKSFRMVKTIVEDANSFTRILKLGLYPPFNELPSHFSTLSIPNQDLHQAVKRSTVKYPSISTTANPNSLVILPRDGRWGSNIVDRFRLNPEDFDAETSRVTSFFLGHLDKDHWNNPSSTIVVIAHLSNGKTMKLGQVDWNVVGLNKPKVPICEKFVHLISSRINAFMKQLAFPRDDDDSSNLCLGAVVWPNPSFYAQKPGVGVTDVYGTNNDDNSTPAFDKDGNSYPFESTFTDSFPADFPDPPPW